MVSGPMMKSTTSRSLPPPPLLGLEGGSEGGPRCAESGAYASCKRTSRSLPARVTTAASIASSGTLSPRAAAEKRGPCSARSSSARSVSTKLLPITS